MNFMITQLLVHMCVSVDVQVSGEEELKKASLKSLGLTGGSAIVR